MNRTFVPSLEACPCTDVLNSGTYLHLHIAVSWVVLLLCDAI
jgi:hypothetical protein